MFAFSKLNSRLHHFLLKYRNFKKCVVVTMGAECAPDPVWTLLEGSNISYLRFESKQDP